MSVTNKELKITLNQKSIALLASFTDEQKKDWPESFKEVKTGNSKSGFDVKLADVLNIISNKLPLKDQSASRFSYAELHASLLKDMQRETPVAEEETKSNWKTNLKKVGFWFTMIAGTLFYAMEGFDGITAMLGMFNAPLAVTAGVGAAFALVSIAVFYGFEAQEVSKELGVSFKQATKMLDIYLEQLAQIKKFQATIFEHLLRAEKAEDYKRLLLIADICLQQEKELKTAVEVYNNRSNSWSVKAATYCSATIAGVLFFSSGFFTGQGFMLGIAALGVTVPPVAIVTVCVLAAVALLVVYLFAMRPGLQRLIGQRMGVDEKKIKKLSTGVGELKESLNTCKHEIRAEETKVQQAKTQQQQSKRELRQEQEKVASLELENAGLKKQLEQARSQTTAYFDLSPLFDSSFTFWKGASNSPIQLSPVSEGVQVKL